jgi:diketogulonate reductase-like aldo/keto reductase
MKTISVQGVEVPTFLYGTAWKEDDTERLVTQALAAGFTGIDTANQRKHYNELAVGEAVRKANRPLFLQTKFTHIDGQDHRLPYDASAPLGDQVRQSFQSSLEHLHVEVIDSYVLHGPSTRVGFSSGDLEVWRAMEALHESKRARLLGVSNVSADQLDLLCSRARIPPAMVQNRCYASLGWDREVRDVCRKRGVIYQGFSVLTANSSVLRSAEVSRIAQRLGRTPAQIIFRFALQIGMVCLTGSTDRAHLAQDLDCYQFELTPAEVAAIEDVAV